MLNNYTEINNVISASDTIIPVSHVDTNEISSVRMGYNWESFYVILTLKRAEIVCKFSTKDEAKNMYLKLRGFTECQLQHWF